MNFNGTVKVVDIAGSAGSTAILATGPLRYLKIIESALTAAGGANTLQGFQYQLSTTDPTTGVVTLGPWIPVGTPSTEAGSDAYDTMQLGDPMALQGSSGSILGNAGGYIIGIGATNPTTLCKLRSSTATPTSVVVTQYY